MGAALSSVSSPIFPAETAGSRQKPQSIRFLLSCALLAGAVALGIGFEVLGPPWAATMFRTARPDSFGSIVLILCALFVTVLVHEGGHLLVALALDFEITGALLGPVRLTRLHGKSSWRRSGSNPFRASISAVPRNMKSWRWRMLSMVAAGPLATMLLAIASVVGFLHAAPERPFAVFAAALSEINLFIFVLGLIPNGADAPARNDAELLLELARDGNDCHDLYSYHLLRELETRGVRPRDYPIQIVGRLTLVRGRRDIRAACARSVSLWAFDRGDVQLATEWDRLALQLSEFCDRRLRNAVLAGSGCFDALALHDFSSAECKLSQVDFRRLSPDSFARRASAVSCLVTGRIHEAITETVEAHGIVAKPLPFYEFEAVLLRILYRKATAYHTRVSSKVAAEHV